AVEATLKHRSVADGSAVVTGAIVALLLPADAPPWLAAIAGALAIGLGKAPWGGLGKNPFNPAALSRAVLMVALPAHFFAPAWRWDAVTAASPLSKEIGATAPSWTALVVGDAPGCLGQAAPWAVVAGGLLLVALRTIDWRVPLAYLSAIAAIALVLPGGARVTGHAPWLVGDPMLHLFGGGTLVAAFFLLTDPATAPMSQGGRIAFAWIAAIATMAIRNFTPYPDGAALAVLLANACAPWLDRVTIERRTQLGTSSRARRGRREWRVPWGRQREVSDGARPSGGTRSSRPTGS
ncbi:MAG: RnfABCDGE type electron transport complex subunit D, partial [Myxococcales bacterium]|nr:RnfABCDGE type electron transport complex subunit D [Myxococcales bacterium]